MTCEYQIRQSAHAQYTNVSYKSEINYRMDFDERLKAYENRYIHEIDTREKIEARVKTPFAIFLVVFTLIGFLFKETVLLGNLNFDWTFWASYVLSALFFVISVCFFLRALYGYHYLLMPTPEVLEEYLEKTIEEYSKVDAGKAKSWAKEALKEYLFESYLKYASQNTKNNDTKSLNISRCLGTLITSFIIICASYLPYYAGILEQTENNNVQQTATATTSTTERSERSATGQTSEAHASPAASGKAKVK